MECKKIIWKRYKENNGIVTKFNEENLDKQDFLECIEDIMEKGNLTMLDLLHYYSTKDWRR